MAYGFEINPYNPCVVNKRVNGKQLTVMWHVDDVKSSHVDSKVNDIFYIGSTKSLVLSEKSR